jgi:apolipoprotein N-acyltransferase
MTARYGLVFAGIVGTAILLALALPLGEQAYLAWFCLTPLLLATRDRGFLIGCLCALASLAIAALLVVEGPFYRSRDPLGAPVMALAGFAQFGVAIGAGVAIWSDSTLNRRPAWWFASLATLLEAALLLTLPANLALTQYRQPVPLLLASLGGVWLVSFLLYWANFSLALLPTRKFLAAAAVMVAASLALAPIKFRGTGPVQRFACIQIPGQDVDRLKATQIQASTARPALVVWPELSGLSMAPNGDSADLRSLSARQGAAPFVTSFEDAHRKLPHNVSAVFSHGMESQRYAKRKMFGSEGSVHAPGSRPVAVEYPGGRVGLAICFDSCYPEVIRDLARIPGVNVIALPTIDPFASNHFLAAVHASYSPFRCAEEGIPMVRADGRAYSQIVDAFGTIVAEQPPGEAILTGEVATGRHWTLYGRLGDWFLFVCGGLFVYGWVRHRPRRRPRQVEVTDPSVAPKKAASA